MADKKAKPAASTPAQSYPDPYWPGSSTGPNMFSNAPPMTSGANGIDFNPQGAMANTPRPGWGYSEEQRQTTPIANAAAMRGYLRNAPYLEDIINSPYRIASELNNLGDPPEDDVVGQYRKRVLISALRDIYNMSPSGAPGYLLTRNQSQTPDDVMTLINSGQTPTTLGSR